MQRDLESGDSTPHWGEALLRRTDQNDGRAFRGEMPPEQPLAVPWAIVRVEQARRRPSYRVRRNLEQFIPTQWGNVYPLAPDIPDTPPRGRWADPRLCCDAIARIPT